jgi:uncharacterized protein YkwD
MLHAMRLALLLTIGAVLGGCPVAVVPVGTTLVSGIDAIGPTAGSGEFPDCYVPAQGSEWAAEVIQLVNDERAKYGLDPLDPSAELSEQANIAACNMIHYNYFSHVNPVTGSSPIDRFEASGFDGHACGENIAAGQPSPADVVDGWIHSPDHEANILCPAFTHLGVGIREGGEYRVYWVQLFGGP